MLSDDRPTDPAWLPIFSKEEHFITKERTQTNAKINAINFFIQSHSSVKFRFVFLTLRNYTILL